MDPPGSPLVRQLTLDKWQTAEASAALTKLKLTPVQSDSVYTYRIVRDEDGILWRETVVSGVVIRKQSF